MNGWINKYTTGTSLRRRKWVPIPVFLPGEFHGQRSLEGYSQWGYKESDTTEWLTLLGLPKHPLPSFVHPSPTHPHKTLTPPHFEQVPGFQLSVHLVHVHPLLREPWAPQWCLRPTERHLPCAQLMLHSGLNWGGRMDGGRGGGVPSKHLERQFPACLFHWPDAVLIHCTLFLRMGHRGFVCARKCQKCPTENIPLSVSRAEKKQKRVRRHTGTLCGLERLGTRWRQGGVRLPHHSREPTLGLCLPRFST